MCAKIPTGNEDPGNDIYDRLDFSGISFPSDGLNVGKLRRIYPGLFDHGLEKNGELQPHFFRNLAQSEPTAEDLGSLLFSERLVAAFAYGEARGIPEPDGWEGQAGLQGFKKDLVDFYTKLGIASGEQHASQLIRDIERQAQSLVPDIPR